MSDRVTMQGCILHGATVYPDCIRFWQHGKITFSPCDIQNLRMMPARKPRFGKLGERLALWLMRVEAPGD